MQREAKRIRAELAKVHIEAETKGVKVVVTAEQEIVSITFPEGMSLTDAGENAKDAINRAMKKAQGYAAEKMQGIMKQMGLGGAEGELPAA